MRGSAEMRKWAVAVFLAAVFLDQGSKVFISFYLEPSQIISVVPGLLNIVHIKNPGAAFGLLKAAGAAATVLLSLISVLAIIVLTVLLRKAETLSMAVSLSLIAAGATGNLIDRVLYGAVVDFLDFHVGGYHWPAFNVADSAITAGVGIVVFLSFREQSRRK
jgi:signal peptidase II